jgi:hypothetical protein
VGDHDTRYTKSTYRSLSAQRLSEPRAAIYETSPPFASTAYSCRPSAAKGVLNTDAGFCRYKNTLYTYAEIIKKQLHQFLVILKTFIFILIRAEEQDCVTSYDSSCIVPVWRAVLRALHKQSCGFSTVLWPTYRRMRFLSCWFHTT